MFHIIQKSTPKDFSGGILKRHQWVRYMLFQQPHQAVMVLFRRNRPYAGELRNQGVSSFKLLARVGGVLT
ncbi:hypothetical protein HanRHA438_Chr12g0575911 [Helianthus annuus]|nr:hypothetical protein HanIR_Chr12g0609731 [Helianthus annuus]KAJ0868559.1 hypothetical protein HanRHA438_Chr12g0575911 [Helianthus annuus]